MAIAFGGYTLSPDEKEQVLEKVVSCSIHPGIGIARLGNSPDEYFIGPEYSGQQPPEFFRDKNGQIKRQAARFRIYAYDDKGELVQELTSDDANMIWDVHLANTKASRSSI